MSLTSDRARKNYISQCKLCRRVIHSGQEYRWCTLPLGLVHVSCPV